MLCGCRTCPLHRLTLTHNSNAAVHVSMTTPQARPTYDCASVCVRVHKYVCRRSERASTPANVVKRAVAYQSLSMNSMDRTGQLDRWITNYASDRRRRNHSKQLRLNSTPERHRATSPNHSIELHASYSSQLLTPHPASPHIPRDLPSRLPSLALSPSCCSIAALRLNSHR